MKTFLSIITCLLLITNYSQAQTKTKFTLKGKVIDSKTKEPLSFAHIGIPEARIGTTTSDVGAFEFKIPHDEMDAYLLVSFIGYKNFKEKVKNLDNPVVIELEADATSITEIEVLGEAAIENIIRKAVKNIPKNYPTFGHTNLAFYRESRTNKDSQYVYLAEGVLNVYKKSYKSRKEGQVSLVQGRKINLKNPLDTTITNGLSSGHMAAHRFDFVYNLEDFLDETYFPVYKYWIESMTTYNGNPVYIIAFGKDYELTEPVYVKNKNRLRVWRGENDSQNLNLNLGKKRLLKPRMKGRVYIDKNTYAIVKGEFEITKEGLKKYNDYPLYSGAWKGNSYIVNYRQLGDKWYFSDAFRKGVYSDNGLYTNEVKITEINPKKSKSILYDDRMTRNQKFTKMTGSYDPDFWKNYNITPLTAELSASLEQYQNAQEAQRKLDPIYLAELQLKRDSIEFVKRQNEAEERKADMDFNVSEMEQYSQALSHRKNKRKKEFTRFKSSFGLGTHLIRTEQTPLEVTLLTDEEPRETILTIDDEIKARDFEIIGTIDVDYFLTKNISVRLGSSLDFFDSRYKERSVGIGTQFNLSKRRPFYFRALAQYSNLKYYRNIGIEGNDFGNFKIDGEKFKANNIKVAYGSRTHNLKVSAELAIELNRGREFYIRGDYLLPFSRRQDIWLQERKELFRKKSKVPVKNDRVILTQNGELFDQQILPDETFRVSFGWIIK